MTLEKIVRQKLSEAEPAVGRHEWSTVDAESGWTLYFVAEKRDEWSTVLREMVLRRPEGTGDLAKWASAIADRVDLESLKVIEIDSNRSEAILRSATPVEREGKLYYYEVLLRGTTSALLRRYQGSFEAGARRTEVPFAIPNETLAKLAGDLAG